MNDTKRLSSGDAEVGHGADKAKLTIGAILVLAGIVGYYVLSDQASWIRWAAVFAGLVLGIVVYATSSYGSQTKQFFLDSRIELRKVVWPTREETGRVTLVVFAFVIVAGLFFWGLDFILGWITRAVTGQGG